MSINAEQKITETFKTPEPVASPENGAQPLLKIDDLHIWYELKRFGFGHAGYVLSLIHI